MHKAFIATFFVYLLTVSGETVAQDTATDTSTQTQQATKDAQAADQSVSPLSQLGSDFHNSIKLLQNRFRIDYKVDEISMVFFREYGSAPVVLVRPDGSKIFQGQADGERVFWYDSATYDLISIKNPVPGPWQAVGQILPGSRVMVLSDIALHADPLPDIIFSGEILKQTAYLTNGGEPINYAEFRDVVSLNIILTSTNNPNYNNFGTDSKTIATFEDNGMGMDETPLDGVFTGQFNLAVPEGEWVPTFIVQTPLFSREQVDEPLMLYPNPIKLSVLLDGGGEGYHKLIVDAEREHIDMNSLLIDGKIRFPNGDVQNFSLTEQSPDAREHQIVNYEFGIYRAKVTVYGATKSGRDFILDVPEYSFLVEEPEPEPVVVETPPGQQGGADTAGADEAVVGGNGTAGNALQSPDMSVIQSGEPEEDEMSTGTLVSLIVGINLTLLLIGSGVIWFVARDKKPKPLLAEEGSSQNASNKKSGKSKSDEDDDDGLMELNPPES